MCDNWELTAQLYSSLISRPKMSEKHLTKPPFRYLADMILEAIKETGFANGLYEGDDLISKAISERDAKMLWLEKIIKTVSYAKGEKMDVKASKIIAGLEPERTNNFLQILHEVATSGKDTTKIVAKVKAKLEGGQDDGGAEDDGGAAAAAAEEEEKRRAAGEKKKKRAADKAAQESAIREEEERRAEAEAAEVARKEADRDQRRKDKQRKADEKRLAEERGNEERAVEENANRGASESKVQSKIDKGRTPQGLIIEGDGAEDADEMVLQNEGADALGSGVNLDDVNAKQHGKFLRGVAQDQADLAEDTDKKSAEPESKGGIKMSMPSRKKAKQNLGAGAAGKSDGKDRGGMSSNDMEYMKSAIQTLCQATNPLGKSMEFVQDDIESMMKEHESWRKEYANAQGKLDEEMRITEESLQPMYDKLAEVEERIREQVTKINNVRAQIIKNDSSIQGLLSGVVNPRQ